MRPSPTGPRERLRANRNYPGSNPLSLYGQQALGRPAVAFIVVVVRTSWKRRRRTTIGRSTGRVKLWVTVTDTRFTLSDARDNYGPSTTGQRPDGAVDMEHRFIEGAQCRKLRGESRELTKSSGESMSILGRTAQSVQAYPVPLFEFISHRFEPSFDSLWNRTQ